MNNKKIILPGSPANWTGKLILPGQDLPVQENKQAPANPEKQAGLVGIPELAELLQILPKSLRARLRKSGYKTSGTSWSWSKDSDELAEIIKNFSKK